MRQSDNKDILIRVISDYYKSLKNVNRYKDLNTIDFVTIHFVDAYASLKYGEKSDEYLSVNVREKRNEKYFFRYVCFSLWFLVLLVTACWLNSNIAGLINDFFYSDFEYYIPYKNRHYHSLQIGLSMLIFFIVLTIIMKSLFIFVRYIKGKNTSNAIELSVYKNKIYHMKYQLKETPWQEVNDILKKMKENGIEFPIGYNFKV